MIKEKEVKFLRPHSGQVKAIEGAARFNVWPIGRRFGKSETIVRVLRKKGFNATEGEMKTPMGATEWHLPLVAPALFEGKLVGIFSPEFKDVAPVWETLTTLFEPLIAKKDATAKVAHTVTGGVIEFWSIPNIGSQDKGRGRKYHRIIYEEGQKIPDEVFEYHFNKVSLPCLTDFKGDCFVLGTPNGKNNYFYTLAQRGVSEDSEDIEPSKISFPGWKTHRMTTYDNPFIDRAEIDQMKLILDDHTFRQEFMAEFIDYSGNAWAYAVSDEAVQKRVFKQGLKYSHELPLLISFDFNKRPMTAVAAQMWPLGGLDDAEMNAQTFSRPAFGCSVLKSFKTNENIEASIYDTCRLIREWVLEQTGHRIGIWPDDPTMRHSAPFIRVTGDASGDTADGRSKEPMGYYDIICDELGLNKNYQLTIPKKNPYHADSFVQVNTWLSKNTQLFIDEIEAAELKKDLFRVKANSDRTINKKDALLSHLLDCFRYLLWNFGKN